ncbi:arrestin domain-containing protein 5-like [Ostrinia nubilalis]|uniref:arrestin domain-containing protein 5-like n=1 Tax=Ostrinia nubilalis TaxID=29057 RepID=UPI0030822DF4
MVWDYCSVNLNSDSTGSFYAGDIVTGSVYLKFKQRKNIERIEFIVVGTSKAQWTRPRPTMPHIKIYSEKKKLLHITEDLFENIQGKTVEPGVLTYPFHFALPNDLPSTFESGFAKVHYCIKIKSKGVCKRKKVTPFVVFGNINLNHIEEYLETSKYTFHKTCWNSETVSFIVKTYTAFASKQTVPLEITVKNETKIKILKLTVFLIQKLRYSIREGYADEEKKISKVEHDKFQNTKEESFALSIEIPHICPTSLHIPEPMINISYALRIEIKFPFHSTFHEDIPVTVATVPVLHYDFNENNE